LLMRIKMKKILTNPVLRRCAAVLGLIIPLFAVGVVHATDA
jgi:hypothetical protein